MYSKPKKKLKEREEVFHSHTYLNKYTTNDKRKKAKERIQNRERDENFQCKVGVSYFARL